MVVMKGECSALSLSLSLTPNSLFVTKHLPQQQTKLYFLVGDWCTLSLSLYEVIITPRRYSDDVLKRIIFLAKELFFFGKLILLWLTVSSNNFTRKVFLALHCSVTTQKVSLWMWASHKTWLVMSTSFHCIGIEGFSAILHETRVDLFHFGFGGEVHQEKNAMNPFFLLLFIVGYQIKCLQGNTIEVVHSEINSNQKRAFCLGRANAFGVTLFILQ